MFILYSVQTSLCNVEWYKSWMGIKRIQVYNLRAVFILFGLPPWSIVNDDFVQHYHWICQRMLHDASYPSSSSLFTCVRMTKVRKYANCIENATKPIAWVYKNSYGYFVWAKYTYSTHTKKTASVTLHEPIGIEDVGFSYSRSIAAAHTRTPTHKSQWNAFIKWCATGDMHGCYFAVHLNLCESLMLSLFDLCDRNRRTFS